MRNIFVIAALIVVGCSTSDKPTDLPSLYPCTVTITQNNSPLAEAMVEFVPVDSSNAKYRAASITDENGKVSMKTYGFPGVPIGKYKVVVSKNIQDDLVYAYNPSTEQKEIVSFKKYQMVDPQYSSAETTPHEIEITDKKRKEQYVFDVGKTVKILISSP
ncbi:MAG: carboxypeptidase-like regulatory domain-containing protein [Planctomycetaceae bacterium]|jgi:hypothetical protein|nr:carboxypeptidase-like regulatory domain-containing protein [Planctomycetaceae bacterium]